MFQTCDTFATEGRTAKIDQIRRSLFQDESSSLHIERWIKLVSTKSKMDPTRDPEVQDESRSSPIIPRWFKFASWVQDGSSSSPIGPRWTKFVTDKFKIDKVRHLSPKQIRVVSRNSNINQIRDPHFQNGTPWAPMGPKRIEFDTRKFTIEQGRHS